LPRNPVTEFARFNQGNEARQRSSSSEELIVRDACERDLTEIAEIAAARESEPLEKWRLSIERAFESTAQGQAHVVVASLLEGIAGYGKTGYFVPPEDSPPNVAPEGWYLTGVVVRPAFRRQGIGSRLTISRLEWIATRADRAFYFANVRNKVSVALHSGVGFVEMTRDFHHPHASFEGDVGVLYVCELKEFPCLTCQG
jgi:ribosomal protein S18 acetylase RimI-like enzyme